MAKFLCSCGYIVALNTCPNEREGSLFEDGVIGLVDEGLINYKKVRSWLWCRGCGSLWIESVPLANADGKPWVRYLPASHDDKPRHPPPSLPFEPLGDV